MNRCKVLVFTLVCLVALGTGAVAKNSAQDRSLHAVTIEDLEGLKGPVETLELSPNGETLAYGLEENLWVIGAKPGSTPRKIAHGNVPRWSPNGRYLAYYSDDSGTNQLWVFDFESSKKERVTDMQGGIDPDPWTRIIGFPHDALRVGWSPDSKRLIFASQVVVGNETHGKTQDAAVVARSSIRSGTPLVLTADTPPQWTLSGILPHQTLDLQWAAWEKHSRMTKKASARPITESQLFVVDTKTKTIRQLTHDNGGCFNPDWSPDGRSIVCASSEGRSLVGAGSGPTQIHMIDTLSGSKTSLTVGRGNKRLPSWSPDGNWIAYLSSDDAFREALFVISTSENKAYDMTSKLDRVVRGFRWTDDGHSMAIMIADGLSNPILQIDVPSGTVEETLTESSVSRRSLASSRSGRIAWEESNGSSYGVIRMEAGTSRTPYVVLDLNPQIDTWQLGKQEIVRWTNSRGDKLEGTVIKPAGYNEGQKYPLIVDGYPVLGNFFRGITLFGNQAWASRGYVVFNPHSRAPHVWVNPIGSKAYDEAGKGPGGWDIAVDDVLSGVDELIRRGLVDPDRMGLYGMSMGGGIVDYLVTRTNRFKCAVSVGSMYPDWARPVLLEFDTAVPRLAGSKTPWDDPAGYAQLSTVYHLDKVSTPMLLAVGDDDAFNLLGMIEMFNGLRWFRKDVTLLRYPNQGHVFTGASLRDFWNRENAFFDRYLKAPAYPAELSVIRTQSQVGRKN
jgi:dipeptidyl aminopeptidase/acylaminoacyl peptidase